VPASKAVNVVTCDTLVTLCSLSCSPLSKRKTASRPQKLQLTEHTGYKNVSKGSWSLAIRLCRYAAIKACWPRPSQTAPDHAGR